MSKVICSICGTSYPDTATQCPICGCVRPAETAIVSENASESGGYTYVKGGRFSKANVRKRNQAAAAATSAVNKKPAAAPKPKETTEFEKPYNSGRMGLIIVLFCLLLIVIAMVIYIAIASNDDGSQPQNTPAVGQNADVPCTGLTLSKDAYTMTRSGEMLILDVKVSPENCTDKVIYTEDSNGKVVTVDKSGKIICKGTGIAVVTVKCGDYKKECRITVNIDETLNPTEPEESTPATPVNVMLYYTVESPLVFTYEGEMYTLYARGDVTAQELSWVSDNPTIARVDNKSNVYAVSEGETMIHAKYDGVVVASCSVKCEFKDLEVDNTQEGGETVNMADYQFGSVYGALEPEGVDTYGTSLKVGDKIQFGLIHKTDRSKNIYFQWERTNPDDSDQSVIASEDKMTIERVSAPNVAGSYCVFKATYQGKEYFLKVRYFG